MQKKRFKIFEKKKIFWLGVACKNVQKFQNFKIIEYLINIQSRVENKCKNVFRV